MTGLELHKWLCGVEYQRKQLPSTHNLTPDVVKITVLDISMKLGDENRAFRARLNALQDEHDRSGLSLREEWENIGAELQKLPSYVPSEAPFAVKAAIRRVENDVAKRQAGIERRLALLEEKE